MQRFDFDTLLVALNAADRHRLSFIESVLPEAACRDIGVIAMKVYSQGALLKRGGLTTDEALGYALSLEGVSTAIIGCSTPAEVDENAGITCRFAAFDDQQMRALEAKSTARAMEFTAYKRPRRTSLG